MSNPIWTIDGKAFPRNPDDYEIKWDKANVTYEPQADGSQIRVQSPKIMRSADITLKWSDADRRTMRFVSQFLNRNYPSPGNPHQVVVDGIQPPMQFLGWFDTPDFKMSKDVYELRKGEGGTRHDITITCRMDGPGFFSLNNVPLASSTAAQVKSWFGGYIGNSLDSLPMWNNASWNQPFSSSTAIAVSNLGNQEWLPVLKINGPFSSFTMKETDADIDGTGQGLVFTWTGNPVLVGQYLLFNLFSMRCYLVLAGVKTEVYTFTVTTVSDGIPFGFWPGMIPGTNAFLCTGASTSASSSVDFSNNGAETFRYWG